MCILCVHLHISFFGTPMFLCLQILDYACVSVFVHMCMCMGIFACVHACMCLHLCLHVCACVCLSLSLFVCMFVFEHVFSRILCFLCCFFCLCVRFV